MRNALVVAMAALSLLAPIPSSAQGRGWGDGEDRGQGRGEDRGERRGRRADPGPAASRPPPESWNRGQYLPGPYRGDQVPDPGQLRLRQPPAGYDWVRVGRDVYLTQRSTGLVVEAIPGGY